MIKVVKRVLPVVVFIILAAGAVGLWVQSFQIDILIGGISTALMVGLLFYAVISWDDALEHKKRETRQLADVVSRAMDAIVICDSAGTILYANAAAQAAYDLHDYETNQRTLGVIGLPPEHLQKVCAGVLAGRAWNDELEINSGGSDKKVHLINLFLLEEFKGHAPALVSISRDLTERKRLERNLRHSQKLAAVGELAAGVAHEINNPLASIQSQIGLARDLLSMKHESVDSGSEIVACLDEVGQQVQRCSRIVQSLLRFSRPGALERSETCIDGAVKQAVQFAQSLPKMREVKVIYDADPSLPPIDADADSISQILINLMVNAADALQHRGVLWIRTLRPSAEQVAIQVIDHGCGVDPQDIERVFEPFFTTKAPDQGTGLGLSISYGIAQSLGGNLELQPEPQGGTCATLTLPAGPEAASLLPSEPQDSLLASR